MNYLRMFARGNPKELIKYISEKYGDELEFLWEKFDDNAIWRNKNSKKWYATLFCITADKLGLDDNKRIEVTNMMFQKDRIDEIVNNKTIFPAYHMNKRSWITIKLDDEVDMETVYELIDNSYEISGGSKDKKEITDITKRVLDYLLTIPKGKVVTYGQIAEHLGNKGLSRAVGNALHKNPDPDNIPCFRVVNAKGELAGAFAFGGEQVQAKLLLAEGIEVADGRVDLKKYQML